jgi:hypothetical protein
MKHAGQTSLKHLQLAERMYRIQIVAGVGMVAAAAFLFIAPVLSQGEQIERIGATSFMPSQ